MARVGNRIEWIMGWSRAVREFAQVERLSRRQLGGRLRPDLLARGFLSVSDRIYSLSEQQRELYLSDLGRLRTRKINAGATILVNDKVVFEQFMSRWLPVPANLGLTRRGAIDPLGADLTGRVDTSLADCLARAPHGIVGKPVAGSNGSGIIMIRPTGDGAVDWNGEAMSIDAAEARLRSLDRYLLVALVRQSATTASYNPRTTNTVRVLTMVDPRTDEPFVARAVQRIGVKESEPVDNWSKGGLSAAIDVETGRLGPGATKPRQGPVAWHSSHPETLAPIEGTVVPHWKRIRDELLAVAGRLPMLPYVGWDVIPTDDGYAVIEGNFRSDVNLLQIHGGLLADERVRAFYLRHGVISRRQAARAARSASRPRPQALATAKT